MRREGRVEGRSTTDCWRNRTSDINTFKSCVSFLLERRGTNVYNCSINVCFLAENEESKRFSSRTISPTCICTVKADLLISSPIPSTLSPTSFFQPKNFSTM